jgi:tRNA threonylcarbamoyladenosine modification (KEOPS) complex  Pcc1 subunit
MGVGAILLNLEEKDVSGVNESIVSYLDLISVVD